MRKTFAPLDDMLIERLFQPASDLIADRIGMTRAACACFCIDMASLGWIASRTPALSDAVTRWDAIASFTRLAVLLLGLIALTSLRIMFRRLDGCQKANPLRLAMRPHRAVVLLMLVTSLVQLRGPGLAEVAELAMLVFAACALYLGACAEPPEVRRRSSAFIVAPAG